MSPPTRETAMAKVDNAQRLVGHTWAAERLGFDGRRLRLHVPARVPPQDPRARRVR